MPGVEESCYLPVGLAADYASLIRPTGSALRGLRGSIEMQNFSGSSWARLPVGRIGCVAVSVACSLSKSFNGRKMHARGIEFREALQADRAFKTRTQK